MLCGAEGKETRLCFFSLLPRRARSLQVGGDPVGVGSAAGWEVREEQHCVVGLFLQ